VRKLATISHSELADSILKNVASLVLVCDHTGSIIFCSQSILHLLQVESSKVLGMGWWELTRSDLELRNKEINTLIKTINGDIPLDKSPYINTIHDTFGKKYWIQWQDSLGPDKTIIGVGQNITEQHDAQNIIHEQKMLLENKNKDISDSINYAKRIQLAMLPDRKILRDELADSFILFRPKDVVSGDFYSLFQAERKIIIVAADCTGHGIPGAFMSILSGNILYQIIMQNNKTNPAEILTLLNKSINEILKQNQNSSTEGLDIALCSIDKEKSILEYSGANRPLWQIRNSELIEFQPDKNSVGGHQKYEKRNYTNREIEVKKNDMFYIFSDGYADQFGGEKEKKMMTKTFKELILSVCYKPMIEQKKELQLFFKKWSGLVEQTDDVLVIGFKI